MKTEVFLRISKKNRNTVDTALDNSVWALADSEQSIESMAYCSILFGSNRIE